LDPVAKAPRFCRRVVLLWVVLLRRPRRQLSVSATARSLVATGY